MLGICYILHLTFAVNAFASVSFVALMSCYANAATDFGQGCASLADLSAGDAHHDAEANRVLLTVDVRQLESDIARLAELHPGPSADQLAASIRQRLRP